MKTTEMHQTGSKLALKEEIKGLSLDPKNVQNEVLRRLIQEVEVEKQENKLHAYNRTHNRHNRGR